MLDSSVWVAIFFLPDVLLTGFVTFVFFLSCFALNDPEVLLWAIGEAAKKLPWRKRSGRRRSSPPSHDHRNARPVRSDAMTAGPAAGSVRQQRRTPASTQHGNAYSSDSSACSFNGHAYGEAAYLSHAEVRSARQQIRSQPPRRSIPSAESWEDCNVFSSDSSACNLHGDGVTEAGCTGQAGSTLTKCTSMAHLARSDSKVLDRAENRFRVMPPNVRSEPSMKRMISQKDVSSLGKNALGSPNCGMRPTARSKEAPRGPESRSKDHAGRTGGRSLAGGHQSKRKTRPEGSMVDYRDAPAPSITIVEGSCPFVQTKTPPLSALSDTLKEFKVPPPLSLSAGAVRGARRQ